METFLSSTPVALVLTLGILIFVHELGHFLVARWSGIRVERFSIGFGPKIVAHTIGETEYCISWIPLGGYVKVAGMADVGSEETTGEPWEYPSKPVWVRMAVIGAGPFMNFLFAFLALIFLFEFYGIQSIKPARVNPKPQSIAQISGIEYGDEIIRINDQRVTGTHSLSNALDQMDGSGGHIDVLRNKQELRINLRPSDDPSYGLDIVIPATVGEVVSGKPAAALGLEQGDQIVSVAKTSVDSWLAMSREIRRRPNQEITIEWIRSGTKMSGLIVPNGVAHGDSIVGQIGIGWSEGTRVNIGTAESIALAGKQVYGLSFGLINFLGQLVQGQRSASDLGGPLRIAEMAGKSAKLGLDIFVKFLAVLSVNLAVINLIPIPVLDGGHLFFLLLEGIMRRPLSIRAREWIQYVGLAIMVSLMFFVIFNDLNQMVFHHISELFD
ncbi:MAG: RIP metalloprotease RseP [Candidatus Latescibacterota bacterium]|nr:RIP metalloprotease RseP [Candidatus Latescibacterota bacterium]